MTLRWTGRMDTMRRFQPNGSTSASAQESGDLPFPGRPGSGLIPQAALYLQGVVYEMGFRRRGEDYIGSATRIG